MERLISLEAGNRFAEYPPNPTQFRSICLGFYSDIKLPSKKEVFNEIQSLSWRKNDRNLHPLVRYIARSLPKSFYQTDYLYLVWEQFVRVYDQVCDLIYQGHALPEIPAASPMPKVSSEKTAKAHLSQMKTLLSRGNQQ